MGVKDNEITRLLGWPQGVDNMLAETDLPMGKRRYDGKITGSLRAAENVDLDSNGKPSSRRGRSQVAALPGLHSLYSTKRYPYMLGAYAGNLVKFDTDEVRTTVRALTVSDTQHPLSYDFDAGYVYYCNGFDSGRIDSNGVAQAWAVEAPTGQPTLAVFASGGLSAGTYQVAVTFADADGRESGSTLAIELDVPTGQGIQLTSIPQPSGSGVTKIRVYATSANGETLSWVQDLTVGTTSFVFGVHQEGKPLETQFQEPLPSGQIVRIYRGRMYVARENVLYWSEAQRYGQGEIFTNYVVFSGRIDLLEGVFTGDDAGLYVGAGRRTYFLTGSEPKQWQKAVAHPYGAVPRSSLVADATQLGQPQAGDLPAWLDLNGQIVVGQPNGKVVPLHADHYAGPANAESAAMIFRERDGNKHLVASVRGGTANSMAVSDIVEAQVWKDGVRIS